MYNILNSRELDKVVVVQQFQDSHLIDCFLRLKKIHFQRVIIQNQSKIEYKYFEHFTEEKTAHGGDWQHI